MKRHRAAAVALAAGGLLAVTACSSGALTANAPSDAAVDNCRAGTLNGAGSTFQQNMQMQWAKDFTAACQDVNVNYQGVGSGAGIEQFTNGTVDYAGSDVVMKPDEQRAADKRCKGRAIHVPITAGGVAILYNLPEVKALQLSAQTLAAIFQGDASAWNDPAIAADNPGVNLPSTKISVFYRSDGSGTTQVFSEFEHAEATGAWTLGTGKTLSWPTGQGKKGSDGVTAAVKQTVGGIAYAEASFALAGKLPTAAVKGAGDFATLDAENVSTAIAGFHVTGTDGDLSGTANYGTPRGYPISTVSYVIVCATPKDAAKAAALKNYLTFAVTSGQNSASKLGFAPLPADLVTQAKASLAGLS